MRSLTTTYLYQYSADIEPHGRQEKLRSFLGQSCDAAWEEGREGRREGGKKGESSAAAPDFICNSI